MRALIILLHMRVFWGDSGVTRHLLLRQLLRALFRLRYRVRVRVVIGIYIRFRVRFRVGYSVKSLVEVSHSISVWNL